MSHQTGIGAGEKLKEVFCQCKENKDIRLIKVTIAEEELVPSGIVSKSSSNWRDDYDNAVVPLLEKNKPCYFFFRMNSPKEWLFIAYTPDGSKVREKLLYSATRSTLKKEFGGGLIAEELIGNSVEEVTLNGYDEYKKVQNAPPPLTDSEVDLIAVKNDENNPDINITTRHKTVQGLAFPLTDELESEITNFIQKKVNFLQLSVDTGNENIFLSRSGNISPADLQQAIPLDEPHYYIYRYDHVFQGDKMSSNVFIYTMPGYKCSIKDRMLYSSCKSPFIEDIRVNFGIDFDRKLEVDSEKITEAFLMEEVHPPVVEKKEMFLKPKAPGRRGSPRHVVTPKQ